MSRQVEYYREWRNESGNLIRLTIRPAQPLKPITRPRPKARRLGALLLDSICIAFALIIMASLLIAAWPLLCCALAGVAATLWCQGGRPVSDDDEFTETIH